MRKLLVTAASVLALSACGKSDDHTVFASMEECLAAYTEQKCTRYAQIAAAEHEVSAPRYFKREDCEAAHEGQCRTTADAGGNISYMPLMMGFIVGNMLGRASRYGNHAIYYARPDYRCPPNQNCVQGGASSGARFVSSGGFGGRPAFGSTPSASLQPAAIAARSGGIGSVARGGFGATASAHGGGGE